MGKRNRYKKMMSEKKLEQQIHSANWKDYYQLPLKLDDYNIYAFDNNNMMTLTFVFDEAKEVNGITYKQIVDIINSDRLADKDDRWTIHNDTEIWFEDQCIFIIRGWGALTDNPYHLHPKVAAKVQDTFARYIVNKLNGDYNFTIISDASLFPDKEVVIKEIEKIKTELEEIKKENESEIKKEEES